MAIISYLVHRRKLAIRLLTMATGISSILRVPYPAIVFVIPPDPQQNTDADKDYECINLGLPFFGDLKDGRQ